MPYGFYPMSQSAPVPSTPGASASPSRYFQDFEDAMHPSLEADRKAAEDRYTATVGMINQAIDRNQGLTNPIPNVPVPAGPNPLAAAAAGFFAHLNQAQGGGGQEVAGVQNTFANLMTDRERAIAQNQQSEQNFSLSQFGNTEQLHQALLTAQRDKAAEMGDLDKTFQHNKSLYALERQKRKEDLELAGKIAEGKAATTQENTQANIRLRAQLREKQTRLQSTLKKEAESRAMTPAQRARMAQANAHVAELRAEMDDFRGAKDIAGEALNDPEDIAAREAEVHREILQTYEDVKLEFEGKGVEAPPATGTPATPSTPTATVSDKVKSAAERLRGTPLFQ